MNFRNPYNQLILVYTLLGISNVFFAHNIWTLLITVGWFTCAVLTWRGRQEQKVILRVVEITGTVTLEPSNWEGRVILTQVGEEITVAPSYIQLKVAPGYWISGETP